jgi:hypothetical protein
LAQTFQSQFLRHKRRNALVLEIIQGKTKVANASRAYDLVLSEIEALLDDGKRGEENAAS